MSITTRNTATAERVRRRPPFGAPHVFVLAVVDGDDPASVHRMERKETIIGRGDAAHYAVDDDLVSKRHCMIRVDGPICSLVDLGSRNGTWINGRRLREGLAQRLRHLDTIQVGNTRLLLLAGSFKQTDSVSR